MEPQGHKPCRLYSFDMQHPVYRNLSSRDTLFGLDLYDVVIMAAIANLVFRLHRPEVWSGKLLNVIIVAMSYLILVFVKRHFPPGYINNRVAFLFRKHRYLPEPENQHKPMEEEHV